MSCTADTSTVAPGLATLPATAVAVDAAPTATIEVNLGMMHLLTLLVQYSLDKKKSVMSEDASCLQKMHQA